MCEQCEAKMGSYGEVLPGWYLMRATKDGNYIKKGQWGLVHLNDPTFVWTKQPRPNPDVPGAVNSNDRKRALKAFYQASEDLDKGLRHDIYGNGDFPLEGLFRLYDAAKLAGYVIDWRMSFDRWLCHHMAKFLETAKYQK